jgi:hypothetical protein
MKYKKTLSAVPSVSADKRQDKIGILVTTQEASNVEINIPFEMYVGKSSLNLCYTMNPHTPDLVDYCSYTAQRLLLQQKPKCLTLVE